MFICGEHLRVKTVVKKDVAGERYGTFFRSGRYLLCRAIPFKRTKVGQKTENINVDNTNNGKEVKVASIDDIIKEFNF